MKIKEDIFKFQDLVLKWDAYIEDKGKNEKFENIWKGPYRIVAFCGRTVSS